MLEDANFYYTSDKEYTDQFGIFTVKGGNGSRIPNEGIFNLLMSYRNGDQATISGMMSRFPDGLNPDVPNGSSMLGGVWYPTDKPPTTEE